MKASVKPGVVLGLLVVAWTFIVGLTGWYKDPALLNLFWAVIGIQIGVMFWGLKLTSTEKTYGQQIINGMIISLIGGVIIFAGSLLFTSVVFPNYFKDLESLGREVLKSQGKSESEIEATLALSAATQTSFIQALLGFIGTFVTGLITSLILGSFLKKK